MKDPWGLFNDPFFIGFNKDLERFNKLYSVNNIGYPPYNIVKPDEDTYVVSMALAGFSKEHVEVSVDHNTLIIKSNLDSKEEEGNYVHKGIALRKFTRTFALGEYMEVTKAKMEDGLLEITVERIVPEDKLPKVIKIR
jgi:molecular chaperone IbpA